MFIFRRWILLLANIMLGRGLKMIYFDGQPFNTVVKTIFKMTLEKITATGLNIGTVYKIIANKKFASCKRILTCSLDLQLYH